MKRQPPGDPIAGSPWPAGARVVFQNTIAGVLVAAAPGFPGYVVVDWDSYERSVLPASTLGRRIALEGSQCDWCWSLLGPAWYEHRGGRWCDPGCYEAMRRARARAAANG